MPPIRRRRRFIHPPAYANDFAPPLDWVTAPDYAGARGFQEEEKVRLEAERRLDVQVDSAIPEEYRSPLFSLDSQAQDFYGGHYQLYEAMHQFQVLNPPHVEDVKRRVVWAACKALSVDSADIAVVVYGSITTGTAQFDSDVDFTILTRHATEESLMKLSKLLRARIVEDGPVPVARFRSTRHQCFVDVTLNDWYGLINSRLIRANLFMDARVLGTCRLLLSWAKNRELLSPYARRGPLSKFAFLLMVIRYFQDSKFVHLPKLQYPPPTLQVRDTLLSEQIDGEGVWFLDVLSKHPFGSRVADCTSIASIPDPIDAYHQNFPLIWTLLNTVPVYPNPQSKGLPQPKERALPPAASSLIDVLPPEVTTSWAPDIHESNAEGSNKDERKTVVISPEAIFCPSVKLMEEIEKLAADFFLFYDAFDFKTEIVSIYCRHLLKLRRALFLKPSVSTEEYVCVQNPVLRGDVLHARVKDHDHGLREIIRWTANHVRQNPSPEYPHDIPCFFHLFQKTYTGPMTWPIQHRLQRQNDYEHKLRMAKKTDDESTKIAAATAEQVQAQGGGDAEGEQEKESQSNREFDGD